jgi:hypothetical protein
MRVVSTILSTLAVLFASRVAVAQGACNRARADSLTAAGWQALRAQAIRQADTAFAGAVAACPGDPGAVTGRGYVALRENRTVDARRFFEAALGRLPDSYDALTGLGLAAWRGADLVTARRAFEGVLRVAPTDSTARDYLNRIPAPVDASRLPGRPRPDSVDLVARVAPRRFDVRSASDTWRPLWIKAVNIGAALPGKHPSEFPPDDGTYDEWLALIARMGANAVRVYTIHPPHFYKALARWNTARPDSVLWLIHGVWTELPPGQLEENYDDVAWATEFRDEMRHVVDLLHGNAAIQPRPGHASGLYDTDVSRWVIGYIIGREWEPYSVVAFAARYPERTAHRGRFVSVSGGNAVDVWLAEFCDGMIAYEMERYNAQRPIAYTNWPTLDPLVHPTESTKDEEIVLLRRRGEVPAEASREFDNDAIGLDATLWRASPTFPAGVFASYHAYPYYPDFLVLDPGYAHAQSPWGPSHYFGYLRALIAHHGDMPVVISEYGVPSSRGNAHIQPQGYDHGGHDEADQARVNARLTREIHAAGAAGAGLFAVIDEWFKKNWLVIDFEQPLERNRLWLNPLDAEQNYGVIAMRAGVRDSAIVIDGDPSDWRSRAPLLAATPAAALPAPQRLRSLHVAHDEAYVYLRLTVDTIDWNRARYLIGIDTYEPARGDSRLPYTHGSLPVGLEFVVDLRGPADSRLLVDQPYNLYRLAPIRGSQPPAVQAVQNAPFRTRANADGAYDTLWVVPNRRRIARDGTVHPEIRQERNALLHARQQETTLADWFADAARGTIEIRLPWGLLHVLDPSSRHVLFGSQQATYPEGVTTDGFRFVVASYDPTRPASTGDKLPRGNGGTFGTPPTWTWPTWEVPRWYAEVKPLFGAMREAFDAITPPLIAPRDPR